MEAPLLYAEAEADSTGAERRREIEEALLRLPGVAQAAVITGEDQSGREQLIGYVVAGHRDIQREGAQVGIWRGIYESLYADADAEQSEFGEDFNGWVSSIDGRPFPLVEMQEWRANTVNRIRALAPRRVLEIGVGSGLLLSQLAPASESYWATDFSGNVIRSLTEKIRALPSLARKVELREQPADRWDGLPEQFFDTIILNSVIQHFPSADYLRNVLKQAVAHLVPNGTIYIGDVRNLHLLRLFAGVTQVRKEGGSGGGDLDRMIASRIEAERELLLAPAFFENLTDLNASIGCVCIETKRGHYRNELTQYRYDVVLHKTSTRSDQQQQPESIRWGSDVADLPALREFLSREGLDRLQVTHIPDRRLVPERQMLEAITRGERDISFLRRLLESAPPDFMPDVEEFYQLAEEMGVRLCLSYSGDVDSPDHLDATFWRKQPDFFFPKFARTTGSHSGIGPVSNSALRHNTGRLRQALAASLPEHMIPVAIIALDVLPLTPDGKLDRQALPAPTFAASAEQAPRAVRDETLTEAFTGTVGLGHIPVGASRLSLDELIGFIRAATSGITAQKVITAADDLMELGIDSLTMLNVMMNAADAHNLDLTALSEISEAPSTVADLLTLLAGLPVVEP
jgi:SAM-dependent methyltransferase